MDGREEQEQQQLIEKLGMVLNGVHKLFRKTTSRL